MRFYPLEPGNGDDVSPLLATISRRIEKRLARRGVQDGSEGFDAPDRWAEEAPTLSGLAAASVRGVAALGARADQPVRRWADTIDAPDPPPLGRCHARQHGFDLHAGIAVPAGARDRLERLCRHALRPPVGQDRLQLTPDGKAVLELRRRWTDGTTHHLVFDPVELLERLAGADPASAGEPDPVSQPVGAAGGVAEDRGSVKGGRFRRNHGRDERECVGGADPDGRRLPNRTRAELMQRSFGFDVLACSRCPGRLKLVALIREPAVIQRILCHLGRPEDLPVMRPSRDPPLPLDECDQRMPHNEH